MTLTKSEIVNAIAEETGFTKAKPLETVETLMETIKGSLESGEDVLISGFGKFCVRQKAERNGRNPAKGVPIKLSARKVVTFKCSRKLRERINA
jgi:integration host factor subunit alpha